MGAHQSVCLKQQSAPGTYAFLRAPGCYVENWLEGTILEMENRLWLLQLSL